LSFDPTRGEEKRDQRNEQQRPEGGHRPFSHGLIRGKPKQETMKPGVKVLIMAWWLLSHSLPFSGFQGFLLKL
jgi:hypothetical protein